MIQFKHTNEQNEVKHGLCVSFLNCWSVFFSSTVSYSSYNPERFWSFVWVLFELCLLQYRHEFIFNLQIQLSLQYDFNILKDWILDNKSVLSETKSYVMIFGSRQKLQSKSCLCAILWNTLEYCSILNFPLNHILILFYIKSILELVLYIDLETVFIQCS